MFELHIQDNTVNSSKITVGWCLDKETVAKIVASGKEANLLLVTCSKDGYRENRKIVPLSDMIAFLDVTHAGENKVMGRIFFGKLNKLKDIILRKSNGGWENRLFDYSNQEFRERSYDPRVFDYSPVEGLDDATINIVVPKEVFAKEPPAWEKRWVNKLFRYKAFDQCHYRKRRIFAYTVQPLLYPLMYLFQILWLLGRVLFLNTGFELESFKDPFHLSSYGKLWTELKLRKLFKTEYEEAHTVMPAVFFSPFALSVAVMILKFGLHFKWLWAIVMCPLVPIAALLGLLTLALIVGAITWLMEDFQWFKLLKKGYNAIMNGASEIPTEELLEAVVCTGVPVLNLSQVPKKNKTFRLKFEALKTKVCRPFQG